MSCPAAFQVLGWFSLSVGDWARLIPFGVAVGGLSYLSLQVNQVDNDHKFSSSARKLIQRPRRNDFLILGFAITLKSTGTGALSCGWPIPQGEAHHFARHAGFSQGLVNCENVKSTLVFAGPKSELLYQDGLC